MRRGTKLQATIEDFLVGVVSRKEAIELIEKLVYYAKEDEKRRIRANSSPCYTGSSMVWVRKQVLEKKRFRE